MDDPQLLRYSRQILLPQIGIEGQQRLLATRVLIIGMGGLGSPVAMYLAASGIGHLVLVDYDMVELSNLQRQIAHTTDRLGMHKVSSAQYALAALNPELYSLSGTLLNHGRNVSEDSSLRSGTIAHSPLPETMVTSAVSLAITSRARRCPR